MSSEPIIEGANGASNRHRPIEVEREQRPTDDDVGAGSASGRRALAALAIAVVGVIAFAFGLRTAIVRLPRERAAGAGPTAPDTTRARRFNPPAQNQPDEYPRLR